MTDQIKELENTGVCLSLLFSELIHTQKKLNKMLHYLVRHRQLPGRRAWLKDGDREWGFEALGVLIKCSESRLKMNTSK